MLRRLYRIVVFVIMAFFITGSFGACKKDNEDAQRIESSSKSSTTTIAKTTVKTVEQNAASTKTATNQTSSPGAATFKTDESSSGNDENLSKESLIEAEESEESTIVEVSEKPLIDVEATVDYAIDKTMFDLGGKTLTFTTSVAWELPAPEDKAYGKMFVYVYRKLEEVQKKYNFKIEYKFLSNKSESAYITEFISNSLAGVKFADLLHISSNQAFPKIVEQGLILPLDDYIDFEHPLIKCNPIMYTANSYKGKHYGTGWRHYIIGTLMAYNRDIIYREGLPDILDLVESNQWTWDNFLNIAKTCTRDFDGDGIIDQYGIAGSQSQLFYNIINSNGVVGITFSDDKALVNLHMPESIKALQFISDLTFIHKVFFAGSDTLYKQGKAAIILLGGAGINSTYINSGIQSILIPNPMGPDVTVYQNIGSSHMVSVSSLCEYPREAAIAWTEGNIMWDENLNELPDYLAMDPENWRWDPGNTSRFITSEREYLFTVKELYKRFSTNYATGYPNYTGTINSGIMNPIFKGEKSVAQAIESTKDQLQEILDNYNK